MNENVARLEKQNPSAIASVLSHSVQGEDDKVEFNQRASSLEHVSEETTSRGDGRSKLNNDASTYNIAPHDLAAMPQVAQKSPRRTTYRSRASKQNFEDGSVRNS